MAASYTISRMHSMRWLIALMIMRPVYKNDIQYACRQPAVKDFGLYIALY